MHVIFANASNLYNAPLTVHVPLIHYIGIRQRQARDAAFLTPASSIPPAQNMLRHNANPTRGLPNSSGFCCANQKQ